ncbi:helix-turn-helix domain-containing protein [Paenibacillus jiagnxiensis]|uniref:helix-turn-helix domain-containing protein n=1 Tax=Paenibacillus jiagnxiensis TaxID=3228926 RepID=UPI0033AB9235
MKHTTTIRDLLREHLEHNRLTLERFSRITGINRGTLSSILNVRSPKPLSIGQLDRITGGMGYDEGTLYELFVDECFHQAAPHWRRLRPFLMRCASLGKTECIRMVVGQLLDDLVHVPAIYDTAGLMYDEGYLAGASILYECVTESEKYSHSERLAMSEYRIFLIACRLQARPTDAAIRFIPYRFRLPEDCVMDGLWNLAEQFAAAGRWDDAYRYAVELEELALAMPPTRDGSMEGRIRSETTGEERIPAVYYARSQLLKGSVLVELGDLEGARRCMAVCRDMGGVKDSGGGASSAVRMLKTIAAGKLLELDLLEGCREAFVFYVEFLLRHPQEAEEGVSNILRAAVEHHYNVDEELSEFTQLIHGEWMTESGGALPEKGRMRSRARLYYYYAAYLITGKKCKEGFEFLLHSVRFARKSGMQDIMLRCMFLYEEHRDKAGTMQTQFKSTYALYRKETENICGIGCKEKLTVLQNG